MAEIYLNGSLNVKYFGRSDNDLHVYKKRSGKKREPIDKAYDICQTYNRLGKNACTSHKIEARDLYSLMLSDIQEVAAMALKDKEAFYGRLSRRMEKQYLADTDSLKKEYENLASEGDVQMFTGEIRRYAAITELDETVLNRLINRILIGEPKKMDGVKTQKVRIVYHFVGEL